MSSYGLNKSFCIANGVRGRAVAVHAGDILLSAAVQHTLADNDAKHFISMRSDQTEARNIIFWAW